MRAKLEGGTTNILVFTGSDFDGNAYSPSRNGTGPQTWDHSVVIGEKTVWTNSTVQQVGQYLSALYV